MVAKFLDDNTVLIGELTDEQIASSAHDKEYDQAKLVQSYLTDLQGRLTNAGFRVLSVPLPIPQLRTFGEGVIAKPETYFAIRTYVNSLLVNANGLKTAFVPHFAQAKLDVGESSLTHDKSYNQEYSDGAAISTYEQSVRVVYEQAGWNVVFVDSDALVSKAGIVHCVTMQLDIQIEAKH